MYQANNNNNYIYAFKLTNVPASKEQLKKGFKPNWHNNLQKIPFIKEELQKAGYIFLPRKSGVIVLDLDTDALFYEALSLIGLNTNIVKEAVSKKTELHNIAKDIDIDTKFLPCIVKSSKGGHIYFASPSKTPNKKYLTQIDWSKPLLGDKLDLPNGVYAPLGDVNKYFLVYKQLNTLPTPPKGIVELILQHSKLKKQDTDSKQTIQSGTPSQHAFGKIIRAFLNPTSASGAALTIYYIAARYNCPIHKKDLNSLYTDFKLTANTLESGTSHKALRDFILATALDPTVDKQSWISICHLYNDYLDRKEQDKAEVDAILQTTEQNGYFWYDPKHTHTTEFFDPSLNTVRQIYLTQEGYLFASQTLRTYSILNKTMALRTLMLHGGISKKQSQKLLDFALPVQTTQNFLRPFGYYKDTFEHYFNTRSYAPEYHYFLHPLAVEHIDTALVQAYLAALKNICNGEDNLLDYLLSYFYWRYKKPQLRPVVFILWGMGGTGKDWTISLLSRPFSGQQIELLNEERSQDKHAIWQTLPDVHISEIGDWSRTARNTLLANVKAITGSNGVVTVRPMGKPSQTVNTICQVYFSTNKPVRLHTTANELRRYVVLHSQRRQLEHLLMEYGYTPKQLMELENLQHFYSFLAHYQPKYTEQQCNSSFVTHSTNSFKLYQDATFTHTDRIIHTLAQIPFEFEQAKQIPFKTFYTIMETAIDKPYKFIVEAMSNDMIKLMDDVELRVPYKVLAPHFIDLSPFDSYLSQTRRYFGHKQYKYRYLSIRLTLQEAEELKKSFSQPEVKPIEDGEDIDLG